MEVEDDIFEVEELGTAGLQATAEDHNVKKQVDAWLELEPTKATSQMATQVLEAAEAVLKAHPELAYDLHALGARLAADSGLAFMLRHTNTAPNSTGKNALAPWSSLKHSFLLAMTADGEQLVVETNLAAHFQVAGATPFYTALLAALPSPLVVNHLALHRLVISLQDTLAAELEQLGRSLPPWRSRKALLGKWFAAQYKDITLPVAGAPTAAEAHPMQATSVEGGSSAHTSGTATPAQGASPDSVLPSLTAAAHKLSTTKPAQAPFTGALAAPVPRGLTYAPAVVVVGFEVPPQPAQRAAPSTNTNKAVAAPHAASSKEGSEEKAPQAEEQERRLEEKQQVATQKAEAAPAGAALFINTHVNNIESAAGAPMAKEAVEEAAQIVAAKAWAAAVTPKLPSKQQVEDAVESMDAVNIAHNQPTRASKLQTAARISAATELSPGSICIKQGGLGAAASAKAAALALARLEVPSSLRRVPVHTMLPPVYKVKMQGPGPVGVAAGMGPHRYARLVLAA